MAIQLAQTGDVVLLKGGTYVTGDAGADTYGLSITRSGVVVMTALGERAVLTPASGVKYGIWISGDNVILDGLTLRGFSSAGIYFGKSSGTQRNLILSRVTVGGGFDGIRSYPRAISSTPVIEGMLVYDSDIVNAQIGFNCGEGPCNDVRLEQLRVRGNYTSGAVSSGQDAIAFESGDNVAVVRSEVRGVGADGVDLKVTRAAVISTAVRGVGRNGIKLWHGGDVVNCLVYGTGADAAIVFDGGGDYRILHTTVANNSPGANAYALTTAYDHKTDPGTLRIVDSIFAGNAGPIWVSPAFKLTVSDTSLSGSRNGLELQWGEISIGAAASPPTALGAAGVRVSINAPKFVSPVIGDYHLLAGSAGIGAAKTDLPYPTLDLDGKPRVQGAAPDLGCCESP